MKLLATITAMLISNLLFTQTIATDPGEFHEIKVFDLMEVNLIQSNENKVVIKGDYTDQVRVINDNGVLKLRMELNTRFRGEDTYIEVYFNDLRTIDANEGAYIVANEMIEQRQIELKSQEGGRIKVGLNVENTTVKAVTGGIVEASGLSKMQTIKLGTGGIFEGRDLKTKETKIGITAAGNADVNASDVVDVSVTAGGDVYIYGNPSVVNKKTVAGGRIKRMN